MKSNNSYISPKLFSEHPEYYRFKTFAERRKALDEYILNLLRQPGIKIDYIEDEMKRLAEAANFPFEPKKSYLKYLVNLFTSQTIGDDFIEVDLRIIIKMIEYLKSLNLTMPKLRNHLICWFAYYVVSLNYNHHKIITLYNKDMIRNLTSLSDDTLREIESFFRRNNIFSLFQIKRQRLGKDYFKTQIKFKLNMDFFTGTNLEAINVPSINLKLPAVVKSTKNETRHTRFINQQLKLKSHTNGYKALRSFKLIGYRDLKLQFQVNFGHLPTILVAIWDEQTLMQLFNIKDKRTIKSLYKSSREWLDTNLPYYRFHKYPEPEVNKLRRKVLSILDKISKTGIRPDISKLKNLKKSIIELKEPLMGNIKVPEQVYKEYKSSRSPKKKDELIKKYPDIKDRKNLDKLYQTVDLIDRIITDANLDPEKKLKANYRFGKRTNRIQTYHHNLQGIPHFLRYFFPASSEHVYLFLDITNQDLAIAILLANDENGKEMLKNGVDIYSEIADKLKVDRKTAKIATLAYLNGADNLKSNSKLVKLLDLQEKAQDLLNWMEENLPGLVEFRNKLEQYARKHNGFTHPTPLGHFVNVYKQKFDYKRKKWYKSLSLTRAKGNPVQATSSEFFMLLIQNFYSKLQDYKYYKFMLPVHDELILEVPDDSKKINDLTTLFEEALKKAQDKLFPDIEKDDKLYIGFKSKTSKTFSSKDESISDEKYVYITSISSILKE